MAQQTKIGRDIFPLTNFYIEHFNRSIGPYLAKWSESKQIPSSLIFHGPKGSAKRSMVHQWALWVLCLKNPLNHSSEPSLFANADLPLSPTNLPSLPCQECTACKAGIRGEWIDLKEILAEQDGEKKHPIKIDSIREIKDGLGFSAYNGNYRITFLHQVDLLTPQAGNALLKLLEEPPPGWILILTTNDLGLVLPTLISRCLKIRIPPFDTQAIEKMLLEHNLKNSQFFSRLALGNTDRAFLYAQTETQEIRTQLFKWLSNPKTRGQEQGILLDWLSKSDDHLELLLDIYETLLLDILHISNQKPQQVLNTDFKVQLDSLYVNSLKHQSRKTLQLVDTLFSFRKLLKTPVNRKLLSQEILYSWCKLEI